ncbi:solute carrier family 22 member 3 [Aphomia sociella]
MKNKMKNTKKYIITQATADINTEDDYIDKSIGAFGMWQAIICLICMAARVIAMWNVEAILFLTPATEFRCVKTKEEQLEEITNSTCEKNCLVYEYENDVFDLNLITEFELICDKSWLGSFTQTILMFGMLIGVLITGWISDRFGRQISILLCGVISVIMTIASSFATDFWVFTVLRFSVGMGCGGLFTTTVVIIMETVGSKHKEFAAGVGVICDGVAQSILSVFAYYSSTWNKFILLIGLFSFLILIAIGFIPETPRWLMANRQSDKAIKLLTRIAKFNRLSTENIKDNVLKSLKDIEEKQKERVKVFFVDLFKTKELALMTMNCIIIWIICGISYFGINQYLTIIGSENLNMLVIISGIVQVPGTIIGMIVNKYIGRKISSFVSFVTIGVSMAILIFIPSSVLGLIGLTAATTLYTVICVQIAELYPTPLRNMALGVVAAGAKIGAMISPFIVNIHPNWVPSSIFAILPFIAAVVSLTLPETKGVKLKDTID